MRVRARALGLPERGRLPCSASPPAASSRASLARRSKLSASTPLRRARGRTRRGGSRSPARRFGRAASSGGRRRPGLPCRLSPAATHPRARRSVARAGRSCSHAARGRRAAPAAWPCRAQWSGRQQAPPAGRGSGTPQNGFTACEAGTKGLGGAPAGAFNRPRLLR